MSVYLEAVAQARDRRADAETVHHRNGINHDNREENLELWLAGHGRGQRVSELVDYLRELGFTVSGGPANY